MTFWTLIYGLGFLAIIGVLYFIIESNKKKTEPLIPLEEPIENLVPPIVDLQPPILTVEPAMRRLNPPLQSLVPPIQKLNPPLKNLEPPLAPVNPPLQKIKKPSERDYIIYKNQEIKFQGGKQRKLQMPSIYECSQMCNNDGKCTAWTMKPGGLGALCTTYDKTSYSPKNDLQYDEFAYTGIFAGADAKPKMNSGKTLYSLKFLKTKKKQSLFLRHEKK